jgi:CBS domain-containing protein
MNVQQLMANHVCSCHPGDTLETAARLMWNHDLGFLPVVEGRSVIGTITDRDICMAAYTRGALLRDLIVGAVMAREVFSVAPTDSVEAAEKLMRAHQLHRLPVVQDGELLGVLSVNDLVREATRELPRLLFREVSLEGVADTLVAVNASRTAPATL